MVIQINVTDDNFAELWLRLWQGVTGMTDKEISVLSLILTKYVQLSSEGVIEPYLSKLVLDTDARKEYMGYLSMTPFHLSNILKGLKTKGLLIESGSSVLLSQKIIPQKEVTFKFVTK